MNGERSPGITEPELIRSLVAKHGRWFHEIELAPGIVTPGEDSNRMKLVPTFWIRTGRS